MSGGGAEELDETVRVLVSMVCVLLPLLFAAVGSAACLSHYRVVTIGRAGGNNLAHPSLNDRGEAVGTITNADGSESPVTWRAGVMTVLPTPFGLWDPVDVNDFGTIVGSTPEPEPVLWQNGTVVKLPPVPAPGWQTDAFTVNDAGEVYAEHFNIDGTRGRLVRYRDGHWQVIRLPRWIRFADPWDSPQQGVVVGSYSTAQTIGVLVWDHGALSTYPPPAGYSSAVAYDGNRRGEVAGAIEDQSLRTDAAVFSDGQTRLLPSLGGGDSAARAINDHGTVVGTAADTYGNLRGVVWRGGVIHNLEREIPHRPVLSIEPADINNRGVIIATAYNWTTSQVDLVLLHPRRHPCA